MYIGTNPFYWTGTLTGIRYFSNGKFVSSRYTDETDQKKFRPYMSEVDINYLKRVRWK